jgi:D-alanyl-D-alanine carboxypeptidase/D-alanyl-D-alanine-endopeptidase (penicillin-binding protein 4)
MRRSAVALFSFFGLFSLLSGSPESDLAQRIDAVLGKPALKRVLFSARVVRSKTGEVVYERNPHLALIPASNMKVVTGAAALERLSPSFAFVTSVGLSGNSLVVIGRGDPLFGDKDIPSGDGRSAQGVLQEIIARLTAKGVASISDIILDTSVFDDQRVHPSWPRNQLHQRYACEVGGFNYNGNCVDVTAVNKKGKVILYLDPPTDYIRLVNEMEPGSWRQNWFAVERTDVPGRLIIRGQCARQAGPYSVAVENPALFFGRLLADSLVKAGIKVDGEVRESPVFPELEFIPVAEFRTPITACLERMNKDSLGLAAEALFKTLGVGAGPGGQPGCWESGARALSEYLREVGISDEDFVVADGSGFSRDNRLSAAALTQVFSHLSHGPYWETFKSTLAVGGYDGTIENHFWEKKYRGRVMAKSGYIQAVRALSGVVQTDRGEFIFSFLANRAGSNARGAIDDAVKAIVDWGSLPAASISTGF